MPPLTVKRAFQVAHSKIPKLVRPLLMAVPNKLDQAYFGRVNRDNIAHVERYLEGREYFAGDALSGADVMMSFPLEALSSRVSGLKMDHIKAFVKRVHARPAYQRALDAAKIPYAYASR